MKRKKIIFFALLFFLLLLAVWNNYSDSHNNLSGSRVVVCVPVYGQSLALGEEAERLTDFSKLRKDYGGRIVTQRMDYNFGYFDLSSTKEWIKRMVHYRRRSNELSIYSMAQSLVSELGEDTLICIFPGGRGATMIGHLDRNSDAYQKFINDIRIAYESAKKRNWQFYVPAICWIQGESDITEYAQYDYKQKLCQWRKDIEGDIRSITGQNQPVRMICYQPNAVTRADGFSENSYECREITVPQTFVELLRGDTMFVSSGPTYPYDFVREAIHIDGSGQQAIGALAAASALKVIRKTKPYCGLIPLSVFADGSQVRMSFNVSDPPLQLDTVSVRKADCYGFSVVTPSGKNIAQEVSLSDSVVVVTCSQPVSGCKVRYAVNGINGKSGRLHGPRGNLRDSQNHWCYQFEEIIR